MSFVTRNAGVVALAPSRAASAAKVVAQVPHSSVFMHAFEEEPRSESYRGTWVQARGDRCRFQFCTSMQQDEFSCISVVSKERVCPSRITFPCILPSSCCEDSDDADETGECGDKVEQVLNGARPQGKHGYPPFCDFVPVLCLNLCLLWILPFASQIGTC